ncbi:GNAT family N-acetyltransferase [Vibrio nigripulchritudo]|uniref:GNAT family N-acetyltransferase n=1 Tax=Vibrio nigripulchritudo TaxID=28173 RepID=UPI0003B19C6F|nr:GNAT family N-acetyltransferase [Vibrio nigripulchritudo]CCN68626.1 putative Acyl-CoA N-acyltransferase [Vibrio nigripulchritudo SFn118]
MALVSFEFESKTYTRLLPMLISPDVAHEDAFIDFYNDIQTHDPLGCDFYSESIEDFQAYIKSLLDEEQGINLKPGYVPCSHRWYLDEKSNIVGTLRIRHRLDSEFHKQELGHIGFDIAPSQRGMGYAVKMLLSGLDVARQLGISEVLVTTSEDNKASQSVIKKSGGMFESKIFSPVFNDVVERYWIKTSEFAGL